MSFDLLQFSTEYTPEEKAFLHKEMLKFGAYLRSIPSPQERKRAQIKKVIKKICGTEI